MKSDKKEMKSCITRSLNVMIIEDGLLHFIWSPQKVRYVKGWQSLGSTFFCCFPLTLLSLSSHIRQEKVKQHQWQQQQDQKETQLKGKKGRMEE